VDLILDSFELGFVWPTFDPFLFCVHHDDAYPAGNAAMGPAASLAGRNLGSDFEARDGWRMYHGDVVPGFPRHPHRGFETLTLVRRGRIDHSDSLGATARFGDGDAQWMTAGRGVVHSEMFPLLNAAGPNPLELFQIWINLPPAQKLAEPHFSMFWGEQIPTLSLADGAVEITVVAGRLEDARPPSPPPDSWAARTDTDFAVWTLALAPGASWTMPPAQAGTTRCLYFFAGEGLRVGSSELPHSGLRVRPDLPIPLVNGGTTPAQLLVLQARPIGAPVAHRGPFVMNTRAELDQAMRDYRNDQFGGWPWPSDDPVHPRDAGRFAVHADGRSDRPGEPGHE